MLDLNLKDLGSDSHLAMKFMRSYWASPSFSDGESEQTETIPTKQILVGKAEVLKDILLSTFDGVQLMLTDSDEPQGYTSQV